MDKEAYVQPEVNLKSQFPGPVIMPVGLKSAVIMTQNVQMQTSILPQKYNSRVKFTQ